MIRLTDSARRLDRITEVLPSSLGRLRVYLLEDLGHHNARYPSVLSLQARKERQGSDKEFQLWKSRFELLAIGNHAPFLEGSGPLWLCSRWLRWCLRVVETQMLPLLHRLLR